MYEMFDNIQNEEYNTQFQSIHGNFLEEDGAGCQNTREWGIRFPERLGLNHNLADPFRENKKFKVFLE